MKVVECTPRAGSSDNPWNDAHVLVPAFVLAKTLIDAVYFFLCRKPNVLHNLLSTDSDNMIGSVPAKVNGCKRKRK